MISDKPMEEAGVKTEASDREVTRNFAKEHVMLGVEALRQIIDGKKISPSDLAGKSGEVKIVYNYSNTAKTIRHIRFSW